eukprot:2306075-Rhodomonas_salina.1
MPQVEALPDLVAVPVALVAHGDAAAGRSARRCERRVAKGSKRKCGEKQDEEEEGGEEEVRRKR